MIASAACAWSRRCSTRWSNRRSAANARAPRTRRSFSRRRFANTRQRLRDAEDRLAEFKKRNIGLMPTEAGRRSISRSCRRKSTRQPRRETDLQHRASRGAPSFRARCAAKRWSSAAGSAPVMGSRGHGVGHGHRVAHQGDAGEARRAAAAFHRQTSRRDRDARDTCRSCSDAAPPKSKASDAVMPMRLPPAAPAAIPVFQSIQLALNQADVEIASLRGQHRATSARRRPSCASASTPRRRSKPNTRSSTRDYDVNKAQYTALLANYEKARLGEQADSAGSVRFEIVQPPTASFAPVFPRRMLLLGAVLAVALAWAWWSPICCTVHGRWWVRCEGLPSSPVCRCSAWSAPHSPARLQRRGQRDLCCASPRASAACCSHSLVAVILNWSVSAGARFIGSRVTHDAGRTRNRKTAASVPPSNGRSSPTRQVGSVVVDAAVPGRNAGRSAGSAAATHADRSRSAAAGRLSAGI